MSPHRLVIPVALALVTSSLAAQNPPSPAAPHAQPVPLTYPAARRGDVVDDYFGTRVADPYRWMEDLNVPELATWITEQNALTERYLGALPVRDSLRVRLTQLWNYPRTTLPHREGGRLFYRHNTGLQRQAVLYVRPADAARDTAAATLVLDPNALSPDGSVAFSQFSPSPGGTHVAYGLSQGGADWTTIVVRDLATMRDLPDTVRWVRFSGISWTRDGRGFVYSRYPEPPKGEALSAALVNHRVYYHALGTPQTEDRLLFERPDLPKYFLDCSVTEDGQYLLCQAAPGAENRNRLFVADLGDPMRPNLAAPLRAVVDEDTAEFAPLGNVGSTLYLVTTDGSPRRRVVVLDLAAVDGTDQRAKMRTVVPETPHAIESFVMARDRLVLHYLEDVRSVIRAYDLNGREVGTVALPGLGSVTGMSAREDERELFYSFSSPLLPESVYRVDLAGDLATSAPLDPPARTFDASPYETRAAFATSKDGTKVPLFITAKKGLKLDGSHPALLYAYGGFSISITPTYSSRTAAWLERGGVYVTASLRGGAEYGEAWHDAGRLAHKQNVFDDFIAAAEYLIVKGYTAPSRLAIQGGSNGGLLVGAVTTQRPDLFAVALPAVGVMDMLRYDKFTGGSGWVTEYGSATDSAAFKWLYAYSPLHNVKPGVCYPATLATTADHDDRVVPSHTYKYVATLQAAQREAAGCARPVLARIERQASHGYRPTDKQIAEVADQLAFILANVR